LRFDSLAQVSALRPQRLASAAFVALLASFSVSRALAQTAPSAPSVSAPSAPASSGQAPAPGASTASTSQNGTNQNRNTNANDANHRRDDTNRTDTERTVPPTPEAITEFQRLVLESTGEQLPIFGASLFNNVPSTFAPVDNIPVTPGYVIGPGDELRIQLTGQVTQQGSYVVDRSGNINFPEVGALHVAGIPYADLHGFLKSQLDRDYRNYTLSVNLGQLRSIQVFVVGSARHPGSYTVSSLSTLLNAVFASGGPLPQGSLRDIQLQRDGKPLVHFDLYDLLLQGDKSHDVRLEPGDVIFIPPVGPQVAVSGSIDNAGIYEIGPGTTVTQAIKLAGGETAVALGSQVRVERIFDHAMRSLADVDLARYDPPLQNGDIVEVGEILGRYRNAVTLRGNVASPGRYVWKPDMRITDLVQSKDQLITREYYRGRNALGTAPLGYAPAGSQALQISGSSSGASSDAAVQSGNSSTSSSGGGALGAAVTGSNSGFRPQTDVVLSAPDIDWSYAVIERLDPKTLATQLIPFHPGKLYLEGDQSQNLALLPGDIVTFFSTADLKVPTTEQTRFVRLEGEFVASGIYSVEPGETLRHLLARVGGFTQNAYLYGSEFTRESTRRLQQQRLNEFADSLESQIAIRSSGANSRAVSALDSAANDAATAQANQTVARLRRLQPIGRIVLGVKPDSRGIDAVPDLALEDGDRFVVPRVPATVAVEGQVYSANAFVFERGLRERDYLKEAGGPDRDADKKRIFILRADGSVYSRQYGDVDRANMFPGDTVVVPPNLDRRAILRNLVDISSVFGGFGLGIAAIDLIK
jgi:protein involved in polysaccharide export with SLBB domain